MSFCLFLFILLIYFITFKSFIQHHHCLVCTEIFYPTRGQAKILNPRLDCSVPHPRIQHDSKHPFSPCHHIPAHISGEKLLSHQKPDESPETQLKSLLPPSLCSTNHHNPKRPSSPWHDILFHNCRRILLRYQRSSQLLENKLKPTTSPLPRPVVCKRGKLTSFPHRHTPDITSHPSPLLISISQPRPLAEDSYTARRPVSILNSRGPYPDQRQCTSPEPQAPTWVEYPLLRGHPGPQKSKSQLEQRASIFYYGQKVREKTETKAKKKKNKTTSHPTQKLECRL